MTPKKKPAPPDGMPPDQVARFDSSAQDDMIITPPPDELEDEQIDQLDLDLAGRVVHAHGGDGRAQQAPTVFGRHEAPHVRKVAERAEHPGRLGVGHLEVGEVTLGVEEARGVNDEDSPGE